MIEAMQSKPPVRLSVLQEDYDPSIGPRLRIFLDDVEQFDVVAYDCEKGAILRQVTSATGQVVVDQVKGEVKTETVRGVVTVDWVK